MSGASIKITYRVACEERDLARRVDALLLEQTVELPRSCLTTEFVRTNIVGSVTGQEPDGEGAFLVTLEQPGITAAGNSAQLLNVLFGNSSLQPDVELVDIDLGPLEAFGLPGPRFGLAGFRRLTGVVGRALTASAIKPMGLSAEEAGALCRELALGGIDVVKDDHGLADHAFCRFSDRVRACLRATAEAAARTGRRTLYIPNLIGTPTAVAAQAREARSLGVEAVMVSPMLVGLPAVAEMVADLGMPVLAHPAFGGAQRSSPLALLGRLFPWCGADAVIYPNAGGRFAYTEDECRRLASRLRKGEGGIKPVLPVPAGGMKTSSVARVLGSHGPDVMLLIGGSLLEPSAVPLQERCRQFADAVQAFPYRS